MIAQKNLIKTFNLMFFRTGFKTGIIHQNKVHIIDYDDGLFAFSTIINNVPHSITHRLVTQTHNVFRIDKNVDEILEFLPPSTMKGRLILGAKPNGNGYTLVWVEQVPNSYQLVTRTGNLVTKNKELTVDGDYGFPVKEKDSEKTGNDRILDRFQGYKLKIADFKKSAIVWLKTTNLGDEFLFDDLVENLVSNKNYGAISAYRQSLILMRKK